MRDFRQTAFFKFIVVGSSAFIVNAVALELLVRTGAAGSVAAHFTGFAGFPLLVSPAAWAAGIAAECSILFSFTVNNVWTFSDRTFRKPGTVLRRFVAYNFTSFGAIVIEFVVIGLATSILGNEVWIRQAALMGSVAFLVVPYNWFMYNVVIWGKPGTPELQPERLRRGNPEAGGSRNV